MKFSHGVYARVEFNTSQKGYLRTLFADCSEDLYNNLEYDFGHEVAADTSSWAEVACIGEKYEHEKFIIEMVEV